MALKIMGVEGTRLLDGDTGSNQDFLMVNIPALAFGTIPKYKQMLPLLEARAGAPARMQRAGAAIARGESVVETGAADSRNRFIRPFDVDPGATPPAAAQP